MVQIEMNEINNTVGWEYMSTPNGICKIIETILCIASPSLISSFYIGPPVNLLYSATISGIVVAILLLVFHVFKIFKENGPKKYRQESIVCSVWVLFLIVAGIYIIVSARGNVFYKPCTDAGIVAICAAVVFLVDAILNFIKDPFCR